MFVRLLKGPQPANILLIVLFSILLWLKLFWTHDFASQTFFAPFLKPEYLHIGNQQFLNTILLFALIVFEAFYMVRLNFQYIFIDRRTYFPAFVYILWMTLMTGTNHFNATVIANLFILIAFEDMLKTQISRLNIRIIYRSGLLIGIAAMFYWPVILMVVPFWFFTLILHGLNWRGLIAQILGAITPWIFIAFYYFMIDQIGVYQDITNSLTMQRNFPLSDDMRSIKIYVLIFLLLSAMWYHFTHVIDKKIIIRKYYNGLFWFLLTITASMLLIPSAGQAGIALAGIPATIFLANQYLITRSRIFPEINFSIFVAVAVVWVVMA